MYCTLEDGVADTIRNRLGKVDYVSLQNIYVMQGEKTDEGYTVPFNFTNQIDSFIEAVKNIKPALQRMVKLAEEYKFALIIIRHVTKGSKEKGVLKTLIECSSFLQGFFFPNLKQWVTKFYKVN